MERPKRIKNVLMLVTLLLVLLGSCDRKKTCPACNGVGFFVDQGTNSIVNCKICEKGKVTAEVYDNLTGVREINTNPVEIRKFCTICQGTGIFKAPNSIIQSKCSFCSGKGVAEDDRYNTTAELYACVDCGGSGKNLYDGSLCSSCYGNGVTYMSVVDQLNCRPQTRSGSVCGACGGRGVCPVCKGYDGHRYGDIRYCRTCGDTGKCHWCKGQGISY